MPPSPTIKATINEARYRELCESMGLTKPPRIRILPGKVANGVRTHGTMDFAAWTVRLNVGVDSDAIEKLRFIQSEAVATLLHELRHAFQHLTWSKERWAAEAKTEYFAKPSEKDAEDFARVNQGKYIGLVQIRRVQHGSGFSKLARHSTGRMV